MDLEILKILKKVLHESRKYVVEETPDTIFDIIGNGHYENQNSRLLAYYMSSENGHNFYKYFIDAIYELVDIKEDYGNVRTYTEYATGKGRIDIIIETATCIIGIENKIYHHLDNDLEDYHNTLQKLAKDKKAKLCLLTLNPFTNHPYFKEYNEKHPSNECKNITHLALWEAVFERINFTKHILDKHMIILNDAKENIFKLTKGQKMEKDQVDFLYKHINDINHIIELRDRYDEVQTDKVRILKETLNSEGLFKQWKVDRHSCEKMGKATCSEAIIQNHCLWTTLKVEDMEIVLEIILSSTESTDNWTVLMYHYKGNQRILTEDLEKLLINKHINDYKRFNYDGCDRASLYKSNNSDSVIEKVLEIAKKMFPSFPLS